MVTITKLYDSYDDAERTVNDLEASGIPHSAISIVANDPATRDRLGQNDDGKERAKKGAEAGASVGAAVGGGAGLLAGLGMLAIPGIGPVVAAGWLVSTAVGAVAGASAGAVSGGLIGALTKEGVSKEHAHVYAEGVRRGGTLITVRTDVSRAASAEAIMNRYYAVDPELRGKNYRDRGWTAFDEDAPVYTIEEVERERQLYR
jgi:hypothetical protein